MTFKSFSNSSQIGSELKFGAVVIGRNEGERLKRCLASLSGASKVIYVDSGSTDGSVDWARRQSLEVVELDMNAPFTAARARNTGFRRLHGLLPHLSYVQFLDGDSELSQGWPQRAIAFLQSHTDVGAVCGRLRERDASGSVYNWLCDHEWRGSVGEVRATGGIVMIRAGTFETVGGYRDDVVAAEDDELCVRMRAAGWRIWRIECEMGIHDAAMTHFNQWWWRAVRTGYAYGQGASLHGASSERHFVWEARRARLWGIWLPLACLVVTIAFPPWGLAAWLAYPLQVLRQVMRNAGTLGARVTLAFFQVLARFPEGWGQIKFMLDRISNRRPQIIEYK